MGDYDQPFRGKVVVFGGDFRQILSVITDGGRVNTVMSSLNSSYLWPSIKVLRLTKNMRLRAGLTSEAALELESFSKWILDIGDGKINEPNNREVEIDIPEDLLIIECSNPIQSIVKEVYGTSFAANRDPMFFQDRSILSPRNADVDSINDYMLSQLSGEEKIYLSCDSIEPCNESNKDDLNSTTKSAQTSKRKNGQDKEDDAPRVTYIEEFLNSTKLSGLPNHCLKLKIGAIVMLLRNIDPKAGLCNGTRLQITQLADHVIEARVITGNNNDDMVGDPVLLSRMYVTPPETRFPFRMRRKQFSIAIAYAMTINKSQGQSLERVGLYLPKLVFTHGQLYVVVSRVKSRDGLKILTTNENGIPQKKTMNVVYKEVFENIK